jgi:hypothetical protein
MKKREMIYIYITLLYTVRSCLGGIDPVHIMSQEIEVSMPDDFHHHLRDLPRLHDILTHADRNFGRIVRV